MTDRDGSGRDPLEDELRRSLAARAEQAPDPSALTERLVAADRAGAEELRRSRWSALATPLVAAACVLAIVGVVLAAVGVTRHRDSGPDAVESPTQSLRVPTSTPSAPASVATPPPTPAPSGPSNTAARALANVRVLDLTFTATDTGWALASAACLTARSGRCTALLHTSNGRDWTGHPHTPPFTVAGVKGCPARTCVTHIRFADDFVGYAYGPHAFYMTVDGANSWTRSAGGADALETVDNTVIRVSALGTGKPSLLTSAIGSRSWTARSTAGFPIDPARVSLSRTGRASVLSFSRYTPGTGQPALRAGVLLRSTDDGATWQSSGDPCPAGGDPRSEALVTSTMAADGTVVVDCAGRRATGGRTTPAGHTVSSADGGARFMVPAQGGTLAPAALLAAASSAVQLVVPSGSGTLYRSTDAGNSWSAVSRLPASGYGFLGFESDQVARLVSADGATIWTTRNGGVTWTSTSV